MKSYTLASERTAAPTGCAYVAPLFWMHWFRWTDSRASGDYQLGAQVKDENHKAFTSDLCEPWKTCEAENIFGEEIAE